VTTGLLWPLSNTKIPVADERATAEGPSCAVSQVFLWPSYCHVTRGSPCPSVEETLARKPWVPWVPGTNFPSGFDVPPAMAPPAVRRPYQLRVVSALPHLSFGLGLQAIGQLVIIFRSASRARRLATGDETVATPALGLVASIVIRFSRQVRRIAISRASSPTQPHRQQFTWLVHLGT
jgi:hypothetical protein